MKCILCISYLITGILFDLITEKEKCSKVENIYGMTVSEKGQGESCSSAMECLVTDAVCDGGQCACSATTYLQGMACLNSK